MFLRFTKTRDYADYAAGVRKKKKNKTDPLTNNDEHVSRFCLSYGCNDVYSILRYTGSIRSTTRSRSGIRNVSIWM